MNGWAEDRRLVFSELERLGKGMDQLTELTTSVRLDVARLQVKAAIYGAGAGTVIGLMSALVTKALAG